MMKHRPLLVAFGLAAFAAWGGAVSGAEPKGADYSEPKLLTGTIYETSSGTNKVLFTFKRVAVTSNSAVHVTREFLYPNGSVAAREVILFKDGKLVSSQLEEKQTDAHANVSAMPDPKNSTRQKLFFDWTTGPGGKKKTDSEVLQPETLVGDMIPYFIVAHWNELARGQAATFRFVAESRLETVGFKFVKESDVTWRGKAALRLRMEPSSFVIAQLVDPLFFIVEKDGAHRVLEYVGRTTPKRRDGDKWKDLDARTVYDWN